MISCGIRQIPSLSNTSQGTAPTLLNYITPNPHLFLRFIYCILVSPLHQTARPQNPIRLNTHLIYGAEGHPLCYGLLPPPDVHSNGVDPCVFHWLHYWGILPIYAYPTFCHYPHDLSRRPVVLTMWLKCTVSSGIIQTLMVLQLMTPWQSGYRGQRRPMGVGGTKGR